MTDITTNNEEVDADDCDGRRGVRDARRRRAESAVPRGRRLRVRRPHFTPAEHAARGRAARQRAAPLGARRLGAGAGAERPGRPPRGAGADASAGARPDPVWAHAGFPVRLLPGRRVPHGRRPRSRARTGLHAQLCGDAHLSNFGIFASPDRRLVFSLNDFDETLPGPFEWDVKRLAASLAVAGRDRGFDEAARRSVVTAAVREYREAMAQFARDADHRRLVHAPRRRGHPRTSSARGCPASS